VREAEIDGPWCQSVSQEVVVLVHATTLKGSRVAPPESDVTLLPLTTPLMKNSNPAGRTGGLANRYYYFYLPFLPPCADTKYQFPCLVLCLPRLVNTFFSLCYTWWCTVLICPPTIFATLECKVTPLCALQKGARRGLGSFSDVCPLCGSEKSRFSCNFGFQSS